MSSLRFSGILENSDLIPLSIEFGLRSKQLLPNKSSHIIQVESFSTTIRTNKTIIKFLSKDYHLVNF